jgi:hypothetical protein
VSSVLLRVWARERRKDDCVMFGCVCVMCSDCCEGGKVEIWLLSCPRGLAGRSVRFY